MPMDYIRGNLHHIAGQEQLDGFAFLLIISFAGSAEQELPSLMAVPTVAASGCEGYVGHRTAETILRSGITLQPRLAREIRIVWHQRTTCKRVIIFQSVHNFRHLTELTFCNALTQTAHPRP